MKELTTVNEQKEKLSSLCRDLQQNLRSTIEKHKEDLISEAKKRNELHDQFEGSLTELSKKMEEEKVKREEQKESGEAFQTKIIGTLKEFEQKEKQYHLQLEKYKIELELSDAKLQQQVLINNELKDAYKKIGEEYLKSSKNEELLKMQMDKYNEKFDTISMYINKNKDTVIAYQEELKKSTEMNKKLIIDNEFMKQKIAKSDVLLIEMEKNKRVLLKQVEGLTDKSNSLEKLCRSLQEERKQLQNEINKKKESIE